MRKLKYYVAISVDNFIAHEDGSLGGFLPEGEHVVDYPSFVTLVRVKYLSFYDSIHPEHKR
jgi:hypothetical protein